MTQSITSAFNDGYIAELYEQYRRDPASLDETWRQYFRFAERLGGLTVGGGGRAADSEADLARRAAGAAGLVYAIRTYGHLAVPLDPLGAPPPNAAELSPEFHGITEAELAAVPGSALGFPHMATAADVVARLRHRYSRNLAIEYTHLSEETERQWFRALLTAERLTRPMTPDEQRAVLARLTQVEGLERFIGRAYVGLKRFSIEGTDALIPMLDTAIADTVAAGAREIVIAMAHRGRLNALTNLMGKPYADLFAEFEGRSTQVGEASTGDVKYHLGYDGYSTAPDGTRVAMRLVANPSHLELVNAVAMGMTRALQRQRGVANLALVVPIVVHGDAAFPGEGIVPETFNLSRLRGYEVGGTLHIIVNNQVGFTTDPTDGRSTHYASDVAKGFEVPIIHVNADEPESCVIAMRIAAAYRQTFHKDFLVDLVGYRRHGHNEGDEPMFTQPREYERIKAHPSVRQRWSDRLVAAGVITSEASAALEREFAAQLQATLDAVRAEHAASETGSYAAAGTPAPVETAVSSETLVALNDQLLTWPPGFRAHARLAKQLARRREAMTEPASIDWGHAESLAFASLLRDGVAVRLSGQDAERGTFSHRHAVLHDVATGATHAPLAQIAAPGQFEIYNSPLSEAAVMAFEYGFSVVTEDALVLWEAQFGDFANMAQPVIDQFLAADRAKWGQDSGLVLLLPHGYEGAGPEHSSARLERFLQLCAEGNLRVAYPSTPAQYFHILRRHARQRPRRPLVLLQPKWMLRLAAAMSSLTDLTQGTFRPVIDDPHASTRRDAVRRLVCCTGKIYWELAARPAVEGVAIVRVEELYPWPHAELERVVDAYPNVEQVAWVQEEPKNQGAWSYVAPLLRVSAGTALEVPYIGRAERASPAEGYKEDHDAEQTRILDAALTLAPRPAGRRRSSAVR
jgi:2-oxoglutarate dehydrogenase E1 component